MPLKWCEEAGSKIDALMSDTSRDVDFCIFEFDKKANEMILNASGKGGRAKVEELLSDSSAVEGKVLTGAFLALAVDQRGSVVSTRRKYIHFLWVGPSVGVMVKGRVNSMSGDFRNKFPACVVYLQLMGDLDELDEKVLEKNLLACGGAHKPSGYDFTNAALDGVPARQAPAVEVKSEPAATPEVKAPEPAPPVKEEAAPEPAQEEAKPEEAAPEAEEEKPGETPAAEKAPAGAAADEAPGVAAATDSEGE